MVRFNRKEIAKYLRSIIFYKSDRLLNEKKKKNPVRLLHNNVTFFFSSSRAARRWKHLAR